jgi:hypothetical protein
LAEAPVALTATPGRLRRWSTDGGAAEFGFLLRRAPLQ